jgi:hypothetical protein
VGLSEFIYQHSWPKLGTNEDQFIDVQFTNGAILHIPLGATTFST